MDLLIHCNFCGEDKPLDAFHKARGQQWAHRHFRHGICKECRKAKKLRGPVAATCVVCGEEFSYTSPQPRYTCGVWCSDAYRRNYKKTHSSYVKNVYAPKACELCGEEYVPRTGVQKYCSSKHSQLGQQVLKYGMNPGDYWAKVTRGICDACGDPFESDCRISVDHCHDGSGRLGVTHQRCNLGIAQAKHDPKILLRWISYLEAA